MNALPKAIIELTGLPLMPAKRTSLRRILAALCSIRSRLLGAVQNAYAENLPGTEVRSHYASAASREFRFRCQLVIDDAALLSQFVWEFGWPAIEPLIVETVDRLPDAIFELGQLQAAELTVVHLEKAITALSCMHRVLLNACVQDPCVDIHSIPSRAD